MFAAVRTDLATAISTITGLNTDPNGTVQAQVTPPAAVLLPADPFIDYSTVMDDDAFNLAFTILIVVGQAYSPDNQQTLDGYLEPSGATSIRAGLHASTSTSWDFVIARRARNVGLFEYNGQTYFGAQIDVEVSVS